MEFLEEERKKKVLKKEGVKVNKGVDITTKSISQAVKTELYVSDFQCAGGFGPV